MYRENLILTSLDNAFQKVTKEKEAHSLFQLDGKGILILVRLKRFVDVAVDEMCSTLHKISLFAGDLVNVDKPISEQEIPFEGFSYGKS